MNTLNLACTSGQMSNDTFALLLAVIALCLCISTYIVGLNQRT